MGALLVSCNSVFRKHLYKSPLILSDLEQGCPKECKIILSRDHLDFFWLPSALAFHVLNQS